MLDIDVKDTREQRNYAMVMAVAFTLLGAVRWWHHDSLPGLVLLGVIAYYLIGMVGPIKLADTAKMWLRIVVAALGLAVLVWLGTRYPEAQPKILQGIAGTFLAIGVIVPKVLQPVLATWIKLAEALNWLVTRVLLTAVFYAMIVPMGLCMQVFSKDPLKRAYLPKGESYWEEAEHQPDDFDSYLNQF